MKTKTSLLFFIATAALVLSMDSCQKDKVNPRSGEVIQFAVGSEAAVTKASYSGDDDGSKERIDWERGDQIRIYCADASSPADKYDDYSVSSVVTPTSGRPESKAAVVPVGGAGLVWSEESSHTFYAVYPSPSVNASVIGIIGKDVQASIPGTQNGTQSWSNGDCIIKPDLKNMVMTSKESVTSADLPDGNVFLHFLPLTTAIQFVLKNGTGSALSLSSVQLISGIGKTTEEPVISGNFSINLDNNAIPGPVTPYTNSSYTITYSREYPECKSSDPISADEADRTLTIPFSTPLSLADQKTLTFTFFLNPVHDFSDLSFKIVESGGASRFIRLKYTDGDGVYFPRHKKSTVTGLVIPGGVVLSFNPDIIPWDDERYPINPGDSTSLDPVIVDWENGINDPLTLTSADSSAD